MSKVLVLSVDPSQHSLYHDKTPLSDLTHSSLDTKIGTENDALVEYIKGEISKHKYSKIYLCCSPSDPHSIVYSYAQLDALHKILKALLVGEINNPENDIILDFSSYPDYYHQRGEEATFGYIREIRDIKNNNQAQLVGDLKPWDSQTCPIDTSTISWNFLLLQKYAGIVPYKDELHFSIISSQYKNNKNPKTISTSLDAVYAYFLYHNYLFPKHVILSTVPYINGKISLKKIHRITSDNLHSIPDYSNMTNNMLGYCKNQHEKENKKDSGNVNYLKHFLADIPYTNHLKQYWDYFIIGALLPPVVGIITFLSIVWANISLLHAVKQWGIIVALGGLPPAMLIGAVALSASGLLASYLLTKLNPRRGIGICFRNKESFIKRQWRHLATGWTILPALTTVGLVIFGFADPAGFASMITLAAQTFSDVGGVVFAATALGVITSSVGLALSAVFARIFNPHREEEGSIKLIPQSNIHTNYHGARSEARSQHSFRLESTSPPMQHASAAGAARPHSNSARTASPIHSGASSEIQIASPTSRRRRAISPIGGACTQTTSTHAAVLQATSEAPGSAAAAASATRRKSDASDPSDHSPGRLADRDSDISWSRASAGANQQSLASPQTLSASPTSPNIVRRTHSTPLPANENKSTASQARSMH